MPTAARRTCMMSATLTARNVISVVLEASTSKKAKECIVGSEEMTEKINEASQIFRKNIIARNLHATHQSAAKKHGIDTSDGYRKFSKIKTSDTVAESYSNHGENLSCSLPVTIVTVLLSLYFALAATLQ